MSTELKQTYLYNSRVSLPRNTPCVAHAEASLTVSTASRSVLHAEERERETEGDKKCSETCFGFVQSFGSVRLIHIRHAACDVRRTYTQTICVTRNFVAIDMTVFVCITETALDRSLHL